MDPRAQGEFVHRVFEEFFGAWQASGRAAITPDNLDEARALFAEIVDAESAALPAAEAGLERTRLLGSPAAGGLGEAVLRMEAERPVRVIERLLEHKFEGEFTIETRSDSKRISLRGKADRIDLLEDGTFRLIDYKLGWPPDRRKALQLPIYSICAEQRLEGRHGRHWQVGEAVYLAFKGPRRVVPLFAASDSRDEILASPRSNVSPTRSTRSRAANFPRHPTMCTVAKRARSRRSAGRIMSGTFEPTLPFDDEPVAAATIPEPSDDMGDGTMSTPPLHDATARGAAVDPLRNVVLEASAGTGKTRVLVERYVNLIRAGVDPEHILAITFTRKAAAEMRQRIIDRLRENSRASAADAARWRDLRTRLGDIAISTIDAFCLSLLREFPVEADVDPAFDLADETETPRLVAEALDLAFRVCRAVARDDDDVALVFAQLGERRLRGGIAALLDRRLVAPQALRKYLSRGPRDLTPSVACARTAERLRSQFAAVRGGLEAFLEDGPSTQPAFAMLADEIRSLVRDSERRPQDTNVFSERADQAAFRATVDRLRGYFLTQDGKRAGANSAAPGSQASTATPRMRGSGTGRPRRSSRRASRRRSARSGVI